MPEQVRSAERPSEPQANGLTELLGDTLDTVLPPNRLKLLKYSFDPLCVCFEILYAHRALRPSSDLLRSPRRNYESKRAFFPYRRVIPCCMNIVVPQRANDFGPRGPLFKRFRIWDVLAFFKKLAKPIDRFRHSQPAQQIVRSAHIIGMRQ